MTRMHNRKYNLNEYTHIYTYIHIYTHTYMIESNAYTCTLDQKLEEFTRYFENLIPTPEKWKQIHNSLMARNIHESVRIGRYTFQLFEDQTDMYVLDLICEYCESSQSLKNHVIWYLESEETPFPNLRYEDI